jgi:HK97 family phage major capsid protein
MNELEKIRKSIEALASTMGTVSETMTGFATQIGEIKAQQEKQAEEIAALKERKVEPDRRDVGVPGSEEKNDGRDFSFIRAARGILYNDWRGAEYEREVFALTDYQAYGISKEEREDQARKREMSTSNDQLGGYLVPTQVLSNFFIELLRPNIVVEAMGATVLDNLTGAPVEIPAQIGGADAFWTGENQSITDSDVTVGQIALNPRQVSALVKMSSRLQRLSVPAAEPMVRQDMARAIAEAIDLAALRGSGASGEPIGIANTVGINTVAIGTDGGAFDFTVADNMRQALAVDDALRGKLGYVMHPSVSGKMRRERIAQFSGQLDGAYVMLPMSDAELGDRLGFKWLETTQIPTNLTKGTGSNLSEIYFGNWAELLIGMWMGLELDASRQAGDAFQKNQVWLKATVETDVAMRHVESFCLVSDAETV